MTHARIARLAVATLPLLAACGGGSGNAPAPSTPASTTAATPATTESKLNAAIEGDWRTPQEKARDRYRHPRETLELFGLKDDMTVVELSPGQGWYTAILAPVLRDKGHLVVTSSDPNGPPDSEGTKNAKKLQERFAARPDVFGKVEVKVVRPKEDWDLGPANSADMVVTFRNFHNWAENGMTDKVLAAVHKVLKPGGVLGLTDHRAKPGAPTDAKTLNDTGYIPEDFVIQTVEKAGFKLAGKSEVNANPKDIKDYPKGVWTLPPTFQLGDVDRAKYEAIGESDRMTLKFVKQ